MRKTTLPELDKFRGVTSYPLGRRIGEALFKRDMMVTLSPNMGRMRHPYRNGKLLATPRE